MVVPLINLGHDERGEYRSIHLSRAPHLLVAGMTGSGKSVFVNGLIADLISRYAPSEVGLLMVDPKRVELAQFKGIPHLVRDPVYSMSDVIQALYWAEFEMHQRYEMLEKAGVRDIDQWNIANPQGTWSRILIIVDELANLILSKKKAVEPPLVTIASMGRAAGVHLLLATQRPSADVMTGLLRANIPTRVCMPVVNAMDSRIMLDETGAEELTQPGQMLVRLPRERELVRIKGTFVTDEQVEKAVQEAMKWHHR